MPPVYSGNVPETFSSKTIAKKWAVEQLHKTGYAVDRQSFGRIEFGKNEIYGAIEHLSNPQEFGAIIAVPMVLKRGVQIGEHGDHKNRTKHTVTFGAPVMLNGISGNMAVVINFVNHKFYIHRIVLPDGTPFQLAKRKDADKEMHKGVPKRSLAGATKSASNSSISDSSEKSNPPTKKSSKNSSGRRFVFLEGTKSRNTITRVIRFDADTENYREDLTREIIRDRTFDDTNFHILAEFSLATEYRRRDAPSFAEYRRFKRSGKEDGSRRQTDPSDRVGDQRRGTAEGAGGNGSGGVKGARQAIPRRRRI